jgi:hypothetical protein
VLALVTGAGAQPAGPFCFSAATTSITTTTTYVLFVEALGGNQFSGAGKRIVKSINLGPPTTEDPLTLAGFPGEGNIFELGFTTYIDGPPLFGRVTFNTETRAGAGQLCDASGSCTPLVLTPATCP